MNIKITSDSTCDLSKELIERFGVEVLPLYIVKDEKYYKDGLEIHPDDIFAHVSGGGKMCTTSALSIGDYSEVFRELSGKYDAVIHVNISSGFSCCHQNACLAAEEFDNVYVVDSKNLSTGQGHVVIEACQLAAQGLDPKTIVEKLNEFVTKVDASFILNRLDYLAKGGRCSAIAAFGANLLKLKPCIEVQNGTMDAAKKYRGPYDKCMVSYIQDRLANVSELRTDRIFITHSGMSQELIDLALKTVKECGNFDEIFITRAGCTVSCHCGENTMGVLYIHK